MYICWSQSPLPFHPLTPPWCLYVCSHNRVSISALQIGLSVQFFWILHKCINIYLVFFFWLASVFMIVCSPSMSLQMTYLHSFYDWVIFHCIYVPHLLYPFLCWWTFKLLPCLGYCKQCCNEHWSACIFSDHVFLWIHAQEWDCRSLKVDENSVIIRGFLSIKYLLVISQLKSRVNLSCTMMNGYKITSKTFEIKV